MQAPVPSDLAILDLLRKQDAMTVADFEAALSVTATAVRQRLNRLLAQGYVERQVEETSGRGRPCHRYRLTVAGRRNAGANFADLAEALWLELCALDDSVTQQSILRRIATRLQDTYRGHLRGDTLQERMEALAELFRERQIPFEVHQEPGELPVLTALACPYPQLAEQDRTICAMERMLFSDLLEHPVTLDRCRLTDGGFCEFQPCGEAVSAAESQLPG